MTLTVSFDYGFTTPDEGETSVPDRLLLDIDANDEGFLVEGSQRVRRIPPNVTGNLEIPLRLLGYTGLGVGQSITIAKREIGAPREQVVVGVPSASLPAQIAGGAIAFGPWAATSGGLMPVTLSAAPSAPDTITGYVVAVVGSTWAYFIEDGTPPLADAPFTPETYAEWEFGVATFGVDLTIAARIAAGTAPASVAETVVLALTDSYFVDPADWTITSIQTEGPVGLVDLAFLGASSFAAPSPWVTRGFVGALPSGADAATLLPVDWATIDNTFPITLNETVRVATGIAAAGTAYAAILLHNTETGEFQLGTTRKTATILALTTTPPLPSLASGAVPTITGLVSHGGVLRADIGVALSGDVTGGATGWSDATSRNNRFRVNVVAVGSLATNAPAVYTPVTADENKNLDLRSTGLNANGNTIATTAPVLVVRPAPAAVGSIADQDFNINDGAKTVAAATVAGAFSGGGLVFSIQSTSGATINASTGAISIPEQTVPITDPITVTATNSGGSAQQSFSATFAEDVPAFPAGIPTSAWLVTEVTSAGEAAGVVGKRKLTWPGTVVVPSGFELYVYSGLQTPPPWSTSQTQVTPGTEFTTTGGFAVGAVIRPALGWRRLADGAFQTASTGTSFTIQGIGTTPAALPQFLDAQYNQATGLAMTDFASNNGAGANNGWFGRSATVEAWESLAGRTAADSHVLAQLRHWIGGPTRCITAQGGFNSQLELTLTETCALAKLNNRVWNGVGLASNLTPLTASEKNKLTLQVQAAAIQGAWCCSTKNPDIQANRKPSRSLNSATNWWSTNPNFSHAPAAQVYCAAVFLGASALTSFLNSLNVANFITQLNAAGLTRTADTFEALPNTGSTVADGGTGAVNPSKVQVQAAVLNWACATPDFGGVTIAQPQQAAIAMMNRTWNRTVMSGVGGTAANDYIGPGVGGAAKIVADPTTVPNRGTVGDNFEFESSDAGGVRSALTPYVLFNARIVAGMLMVMAAAGQLDRSNAALQTAVARMHRGWLSADQKSLKGYHNREKGDTATYSETATGANGGVTWTMRTSASGGRVRGITNGAWFNVLKPWFDA